MSRRLSKSRLVSAWQCPKRLYLETFHSDLAEFSAQTEAMFATGHEVGAIAQSLYGTAESVEIPFDRQKDTMLRETAELLASGARFPIFEATFEHDGVLVRVDVLIPDGDGWQLVEVKASASLREYHALDCAIQAWVLRHSGVELTSVSLAHVDNQFVYAGDDEYAGLLVDVDLTEAIRDVTPTVEELVERARDAIAAELPDVPVGAHCSKPFDCPFINHCWPTSAEYPVSGLGGGRASLAEFVAAGYEDIRDVPATRIENETRQRIHRVTTAGEPEILDGARDVLSSLAYPRYYLDFETIAPAVPIWPDTRPYAITPVQWSCHIDDGNGHGALDSMRHEEFLDLSGKPPMRALAEALLACLSDTGPVLTYTSYEATVIRGLAERFPDLADRLNEVLDRLFDLHPVVKEHYYHPRMLGSWSIKAVLPTIDPALDYAKLDGIQEGTAASGGFLEAIAPSTDSKRKHELDEQLRRYCSFDTEAMVALVNFFTR